MTDGDKLDPVLAAFGANVRKARVAAGLSQEQLADRAGLDRTYVSGIERGRRNVALLNISRLALALATEPEQLFRGVRAPRR